MLDPNKVGVAVVCEVCGYQKKPIGRSAPMGVPYCAEAYDGEGCDGYYIDPRPGSLWPGESEADFGYPAQNAGTTAAPAAQKGGE